MKRSTIVLLILTLAVLTAAGQEKEMAKKSKKAKGDAGMMMMDLPYSANYSSNFTMGKAANAKMVLDLYKDYEKADWSKETWFADTVMAILPDGSVLKGKDPVLEEFKKQREMSASSEFKFDAIIPLMSVDRNEDWVALWGSQKVTSSNAGEAAMQEEFQAIWRINKDNKIDFIRIFTAKTPPQQ